MKIFEYIGKAIDWTGKNISRIKTIGVMVLVVFFAISLVSNGCNRAAAEKLFEKVTGLSLENDLLKGENKQLQDSLKSESVQRKRLEKEKEMLASEKLKLSGDNNALRKKLAEIPLWLLNLPADSSYVFLDGVAYPYPGEKRFPFNEPQIKNIHADYLENVQLTNLVGTLDLQLKNCERSGEISDSIASSYKNSYAIVASQSRNLQEMYDNTEEKSKAFEKALDRSEKRKIFWKATTGVLTVVSIILAL